MNYLSHLYLADRTRTELAGAIAADFLRGPLPEQPSARRTALALHRFVDSTVDQHPEVHSLRQQFTPQHRRMAGILLDLAFDHQMAKRWGDYHPAPLPQFTRHCYQSLHQAEDLPAGLNRILGPMSQNDWLYSYRRPEIIEKAVYNIANRLSQPERLRRASDEIWRLEQPIEQAFTALMPDLLARSEQFLAQQGMVPAPE
ncbi:acyl carrier protein phosphodiesterase [Ferrimonas marina]|uniref:Acyl carrier protein phosphodiesterase n=1 Tax=Ferrimonas marina TaxID=299255 RepID=A0A1M5S777_9GAMM|nr:ACP phosphodiesterase [Ferrimonas marina]SHH34300.1 Acyl carrier protein phosphodiesterase [Ferrimonas marina]